MMKPMGILRLFFLVPLVIILGIFVTSNTQVIEWNLWPLPYTLTLPAYVFPIGALGLGLIFGALIMWLKGALRS